MSQITTHVLDTARGRPAAGITITLAQLISDRWQTLGQGETNDDGRIGDLLDASTTLAAGTYRLHFALSEYFEQNNQATFYPYAEIVFSITGAGEHYHVPLLLQPFGYATYRGS